MEIKKIIPIILIIVITAIATSIIVINISNNDNISNIDNIGNSGNNDNTIVSNEQQEDSLSVEEQFAVDYLVEFSDTFKNPRSIKLYKVWVYSDRLGYLYVAYNLSATNSYGAEMEATYGNDDGVDYLNPDSKIDINQAKKFYMFDMGEYWKDSNYLKAVEEGTLLDAEKIQKAFEEKL